MHINPEIESPSLAVENLISSINVYYDLAEADAYGPDFPIYLTTKTTLPDGNEIVDKYTAKRYLKKNIAGPNNGNTIYYNLVCDRSENVNWGELKIISPTHRVEFGFTNELMNQNKVLVIHQELASGINTRGEINIDELTEVNSLALQVLRGFETTLVMTCAEKCRGLGIMSQIPTVVRQMLQEIFGSEDGQTIWENLTQ